MHVFDDPSSRTFAGLTGLFYLSIAVAGAFSIAHVPTQILVAGDPMATFTNVANRATLFHFGIGADALLIGFEVMVLSMLYFMFKSVSPTLSLAAAIARFGMVAVMASQLFFSAAVDALAQSETFLASFSAEQRADMATLLLHMHKAGVWIWQIFFALHLSLLGALILASNRFPRVIGYGLMIGAWGYLLDSVYAFALTDVAALGVIRVVLLVVVSLSELGFAVWLVSRGPRQPSSVASAVPA